MDQFQQIGPDKPGYVEDVGQIRNLVADGYPQAFIFAARSTAKHVVIVPWKAVDASARPPGFSDSDPVLIAISEGRAAWMPSGQYLHPGYVAQYLGESWGGDSEFADFLNAVVGISAAVPA